MAAQAGGGAPPELAELSDAQLRAYRETFSSIDQANDGYIARAGEALRWLWGAHASCLPLPRPW